MYEPSHDNSKDSQKYVQISSISLVLRREYFLKVSYQDGNEDFLQQPKTNLKDEVEILSSIFENF